MASETLNILPIDDPDDPRIADYANLTDAQLLVRALDPHRPDSGLFMAEGELVVRQLIASPLRARSVLLTPMRIRTMRDALELLPPATPIYSARQELMDRITGFHIHRGILAAGERPQPPGIDMLLASVRTLVVLEDLANHDNLGGIFRTAAALAGIPDWRRAGQPPISSGPAGGGVEPPITRLPIPHRVRSGAAILYSPRTCDPFYRKAIRVSLGAVLHLPSARLDPWPEGLASVKGAGFTVIALTPDPSVRPIDELNLNEIRNPALLLGSEGAGLTPGAFAAADQILRIPMYPPMDSLNVVVAAGIALHCLAGVEKMIR